MIRKVIAILSVLCMVALEGVIAGSAHAEELLYPTGTVISPRCGVVKAEATSTSAYGKPTTFKVLDATNNVVLGSAVLPDANGSYVYVGEFSFTEDTGWRRVELYADESHISQTLVESACSNPQAVISPPLCKIVDGKPTRTIMARATLNGLKSRVSDTYTMTLKGKNRSKQRSWTVSKNTRTYVYIPFLGKRMGGAYVVAKIQVDGVVLAKRRISTGLCT